MGLQRGGFPPSCEQRTGPSPGWELRQSGGATESTSTGRRAGSGPPEWGIAESEGRTEPPQRTDAPGGALAPEGVSRPQIEQLRNAQAERGRAGRPGQSCGRRASRPRPRPSRACPRRGWQRGGESPLSCSVLLPSAPFPGTWGAGDLPSGLGRAECRGGGDGGGRGRQRGKGDFWLPWGQRAGEGTSWSLSC